VSVLGRRHGGSGVVPTPNVRLTALLLAAIVLAGAALRFYRLGEWPPGLYQDEAYNGLDALDVLAGEHALYFPANNGREPLFIYLVSLSVGVLGRSPLAVRLPAAVLGVLTILASYVLGAVLFGRRAGLWTAAVVAFTFWSLALSRIGLRAGALPLLAALSLACAAHGLAVRGPAGERRSLGWVALGGGLYGLTFYTYLAARFSPLALLGFLIFWYSAQRSTFPPARQIAVFSLSAALVGLPLGLAALGQPEILLGRAGQVSVFNPAINGGDLAGTLFHNVLAALGMFVGRGDGIARHNLPGRPVFDPLLGLAWLAGVALAVRSAWVRRSPAHALPLVWTGVMLLPTILAEDTPHFLRACGVLPLIALFPALALDEVWTWANRVAGWRQWAARAACLAALAAGLGLTARDYFGRYAPAPDTGYLFQSAATELAQATDVYLAGAPDRRAYVDRRYWDSFASVRFLLEPSDRLSLYDETGALAPVTAPALVIAWPYDGLRHVASHLPAGALIRPQTGPLYRGDLEPVPYALYVTYTLESCPPGVCAGPALAEFAGGARLVHAQTRAAEAGLLLELTWQAPIAPGRSVQVFAQALAGGEMVAQADGPLGTELFPSTWWRAGESVVETRRFEWPGQTAPAGVRLRVGLYDPVSNVRFPRIDSELDYVDLAP
jgi:4-amino-4-deoxy-L-arabinose transferase-like glycosyltransferase